VDCSGELHAKGWKVRYFYKQPTADHEHTNQIWTNGDAALLCMINKQSRAHPVTFSCVRMERWDTHRK
jgi:hypothetical protein